MLKLFIKSFYIQNIDPLFTKKKETIWLDRGNEKQSKKMNEMYFNSESKLRENIQLLLKNLKIEDVFEFGCNSGPNAKYLLKLNIKSYVGLDINESALDFARAQINCDNFKFLNWYQLNQEGHNFFDRFNTFMSLYSLAYISLDDCKNLLKKFKNCDFFIIGEPENHYSRSLALNRVPEYSHDYENIFGSLNIGSYSCFRHRLETPNFNTKSILLFIKS